MIPSYTRDCEEKVLSAGTSLPCGLEQVTQKTLMLPQVFKGNSVIFVSPNAPLSDYEIGNVTERFPLSCKGRLQWQCWRRSSPHSGHTRHC